MIVKGRLSKEKFGFSMPVDAPLYQEPPFHYRGMQTITVAYESDDEIALDLLPDGLELALPATVRVVVAHMPFTTFGAYEEAYQFLDCIWQGEKCIYPLRILLNQECALAAGRELWGNPKKLGHIEWTYESELIQGIVERPRGSRICTVLVKPERPMEVPPYEMRPIGLRVIPNPEIDSPPSLAELVLNRVNVIPVEAWSGPGSLSFGVQSEMDPWHKLPVKRIIESVYVRADMDVAPRATIIKRY